MLLLFIYIHACKTKQGTAVGPWGTVSDFQTLCIPVIYISYFLLSFLSSLGQFAWLQPSSLLHLELASGMPWVQTCTIKAIKPKEKSPVKLPQVSVCGGVEWPRAWLLQGLRLSRGPFASVLSSFLCCLLPLLTDHFRTSGLPMAVCPL